MRKAVVVVAALWCGAVSHAEPRPFRIMETSVDQVHAAYKAGALTAHQLVQAYLDRIDAYDKKGPTINSIITINPSALEEAVPRSAATTESR